MENLKIQIKIEDNDDLKEAHDLLLKLGFSTYSKESFDVWINQPKPIWLKTNCFDEQPNKIDWCFKESHGECKEITLPELRDLVVLKRNDVGDATHIRGDGKKYFHAKSTDFFYQFSSDGDWLLSTWMNYQLLPQLKPIEKPMKEYLRKNSNGTYSYIGTVRPEHVSDFMIEIPEGATYYAKDANLGKSGNFFFRLRSDGFDFEAVWLESNWMQASFNVKNQDVLWQRDNNQTIASAVELSQPEELPFIDDEPKYTDAEVKYMDENGQGRLQSLNDQYAEIEKVRQDIINSPIHYADSTIECIDAMEAMMTPEQFIGYLRGNVFKYQWRYEKKNGIEDLKKAQWYLDKLTVKVAEKNAPF